MKKNALEKVSLSPRYLCLENNSQLIEALQQNIAIKTLVMPSLSVAKKVTSLLIDILKNNKSITNVVTDNSNASIKNILLLNAKNFIEENHFIAIKQSLKRNNILDMIK